MSENVKTSGLFTSWYLKIWLSCGTFRTHTAHTRDLTLNQRVLHSVKDTTFSLSLPHTYTHTQKHMHVHNITLSHHVMHHTHNTHTRTRMHTHQDNMEKKAISSDITVTASILNSACLPWQPSRSSVHILASWNLHVYMCVNVSKTIWSKAVCPEWHWPTESKSHNFFKTTFQLTYLLFITNSL